MSRISDTERLNWLERMVVEGHDGTHVVTLAKWYGAGDRPFTMKIGAYDPGDPQRGERSVRALIDATMMDDAPAPTGGGET